MEEQTKLLPCPFCGPDGEVQLADALLRYVKCNACETYGPTGADNDGAVRRWNRRVPSAPVPQEGDPLPIRISKLPIDPTLAMGYGSAAACGCSSYGTYGGEHYEYKCKQHRPAQGAAAPAAVAVEPAAQPASKYDDEEYWAYKRRIAEILRPQDRVVQFAGIDPLSPTKGAEMPMIADSWRFGFRANDDGTLTFAHSDNGPFVAHDATMDTSVRAAAEVLTRRCKAKKDHFGGTQVVVTSVDFDALVAALAAPPQPPSPPAEPNLRDRLQQPPASPAPSAQEDSALVQAKGAVVVATRPELLDLAMSCGARLTGKPDGSESVTVVFTIPAWRAFDPACESRQIGAAQPEPIMWFMEAGIGGSFDRIARTWTLDDEATVRAVVARSTEPIRATPLYAHPPAAGASEAREVLAELVALKDLKDKCDGMSFWVNGYRCTHRAALWDDYERRKPIAWANARRVLGEKP